MDGDTRIDPIHPARPRIGAPHEAWNQEPDPRPLAEGTDRVAKQVVESGSAFELFCAVIALALAIVGLAGYLPLFVASIATIAAGLALLAQGTAVATRWRDALRIVGRERLDRFGMSTEMFGGLAAVALGILALVGVASVTLLAAAVVVLGAALLLGGPAQPDFAEDRQSTRWHVTRDIVRASSGVMVMGGLSAIVLGVIALAGEGPALTLALTGVVCIAAALMLAGGSLLARFRARLLPSVD